MGAHKPLLGYHLTTEAGVSQRISQLLLGTSWVLYNLRFYP